LRERSEDVPALSQHFLNECAQRLRRPPKTLHPELLARMLAYPWPGNVRELQSVIWRAFLLHDGAVITPEAAPEIAPIGDPARSRAVSMCAFSKAKAAAISAFESRYLADVMSRAGGNVTAAAKLAGTERRYLGRLLKKHRLDRRGSSSL
jgi:DNA-binding NtrC family response regulator